MIWFRHVELDNLKVWRLIQFKGLWIDLILKKKGPDEKGDMNPAYLIRLIYDTILNIMNQIKLHKS